MDCPICELDLKSHTVPNLQDHMEKIVEKQKIIETDLAKDLEYLRSHNLQGEASAYRFVSVVESGREEHSQVKETLQMIDQMLKFTRSRLKESEKDPYPKTNQIKLSYLHLISQMLETLKEKLSKIWFL